MESKKQLHARWFEKKYLPGSMKRITPHQVQNILIFLMAYAGAWISLPAMGANLPAPPMLRNDQLAPIAAFVEKAIQNGKVPGAVVLIGNHDHVVYRRAFGFRSVKPEKTPMTPDTIFDLASLTKVVATTTAIMQLVENGRIGLEDPVVKYWPAFGKNGKSSITIRQLLTHYSGLRPDLAQYPRWSGYKLSLKKILDERPVASPGSEFIYSDINFEILGELVCRVTGQPLDKYCRKHIFAPLGMKDTFFNPSRLYLHRIAPTEYRQGKMLCGKVQDPTAFSMGGVSGHAGLFSTADDLALFAEMMLHLGRSGNRLIFAPGTIELMTTPQSPPGKKRLHGLGWDIDPAFMDLEGKPTTNISYGHLGYTGTAIWIDPSTRTYIIVLTNRVHPNGRGDVKELRKDVKEVVGEALISSARTAALRESPPPQNANASVEKEAQGAVSDVRRFRTGIDVLVREHFSPLSGMRIGLITNQTGVDSQGERTLDLLRHAPGVQLKAIFSPEHGLAGTADAKIPSSRDRTTGLPIYSLYGITKKPTAAMLRNLDALVFDIQDAGVRFYTYISTMGYAMEAAAKSGLVFFVLDRPNPITASLIQGPVPDASKRSFTEYFPLPVRHGMTVAELANMFNVEYNIGAHLRVVKMEGYNRADWFDETGMEWINPSPNLRSLTEATLYPGVGLAEGANVSVGRGTATPFEIIGAPWIDGNSLARRLNDRHIPGVRFSPVAFEPASDIYKKRLCRGVRIILKNRRVLDSPLLGIEIISALYRLYPKSFAVDDTLGLIGNRSVLSEIKEGRDPRSIARSWQRPLKLFVSLRSKFLLYGPMASSVQ
jgi:uncharacterized protein YbbC (DUF1343 family)/CubicO group peptidase (beta-lactamase class C family)